MAYLEIPIRSDLPSYEFELPLEQETFFFNFHYNSRLARWAFNIQDSSQQPIVSGIPLLTGLSLIDQYPYTNLPKGEFYLLDETGANRNPEEIGLGDDFKLVYRESTTDD